MTRLSGSRTSESLTVVHMKVRQQRNAFMIELLDIAARLLALPTVVSFARFICSALVL